MIREEVGLSLEKAGKEVLGNAAKVVLTKETSTIVGDGTTQDAVQKRVAQIKNLIEVLTCSRRVEQVWDLYYFLSIAYLQ